MHIQSQEELGLGLGLGPGNAVAVLLFFSSGLYKRGEHLCLRWLGIQSPYAEIRATGYLWYSIDDTTAWSWINLTYSIDTKFFAHALRRARKIWSGDETT